MRRSILLLLFGSVMCSLGVVLGSTPTLAQGTEAEYVGASQCASCHRDLARNHSTARHALALQEVQSEKSAIKADFTQGEEIRTLLFPDENEPRPFTPEDVYYVIGSGRYVERYLYRVRRNVYALFPAEWNVEKQEWQPYLRGAEWPTDPAYDWTQNCAACHVTGFDPERNRWIDDGVQCEACHGPGSLHVAAAERLGSAPTESELQNVRAVVATSPDAQVCGQCHASGTNPDDGRPFPLTYRPGLNLLDAAIFLLTDADDPDHWWATGHARGPNMQFNEWLKSGHATALTSLKGSDQADVACLSCHSADYAFMQRRIEAHQASGRAGEAPPPVTLETAQSGVTCVSCHNPHSEGQFEFNLIADSYTLCTSCHRNTDDTKDLHYPVQDMFEGKTIIPQIEGIPSVHFTDPNGPKCQSCHMPRVPVETFTLTSHTTEPILPGETAINIDGMRDSCTVCHTSVAPEAMVKFVTDAKTNTANRLKAASDALRPDSPDWVHKALQLVEGDGSYGIHNHRYTAALLSAVETQLGLVTTTRPSAPSDRPVVDPATCAECHQTQHRQWLASPHAQASLNDIFRREFAALRQPTYCMGCHASGYNTVTGEYVFEGVVCSNCHYTEGDAVHPPAPVVVASDSATCGQCHSGAHAPTYDEWLVSAHNRARIDCVDCHTPHDNGLRQGDVNTTCGNCHPEAAIDPVHMGDDMNCVDCHMKRRLDEQGVHVIKTGHSMAIDPGVCAECHGKTHLLSVRGRMQSPEVQVQIASLESEIEQLKSEAHTNWTIGVTGGAIGMLIVVVIGLIILRRGKLL